MKTIIIHLGGHKTGSTAIQKFLFQNKELLKREGFLFPGHVHAHNTIGVEIKKNGGYDEEFRVSDFLAHAPFTQKIINEINESGKEQVIISAEFFEHFPRNAITSLKAVLDTCISDGHDYSLIYYCRRQDWVLESLYRERIKIDFLEGTGPSPAFDAFKAGCPLRNYSGILNAWAGVFNKENIIVQPYEREQLNSDIFCDFSAKIRLKITDEYEYPSDKDSNIGLSTDLTEFLRILTNTTCMDQKFRNRLHRILINLNIANQKPKCREYLSPEERQVILEKCETSNRIVACEFLGREDGRLFYEAWPDPHEPWVPRRGLTVEQIIPIFTTIFYSMEEEFRSSNIRPKQERGFFQRMQNKIQNQSAGVFKNLHDRLCLIR